MAPKAWPADKVERWQVDRLIPYARNARLHSAKQIDQIAASIREFGWTVPALVDSKGVLIAGHGRVLAAQKLGLDAIPVMIANGWSDKQKRAYRLADNKIALNSAWDDDLMRIEIEALQEAGFDMTLAGFADFELAAFDAPELSVPDEMNGMPEYEQGDEMPWRSIKVHFRDGAALKAFAELLQQSMTESTKFVWYPRAVKQSRRESGYAAADITDLHPFEGSI